MEGMEREEKGGATPIFWPKTAPGIAAAACE